MNTRSTLILAGIAALAGSAFAQPVIDGNIAGDAAYYGQPIAVQNTETQFGDSNLGLSTWANGSELISVYAYRDATHLYVLATGNLETNYNKLELFVDCKTGGQNQLTGVQPDADFGALGRMAGTGSGDGLAFDAGFDADYWFGATNGDVGGGTYGLFANFGEIGTTNGQWLGQGPNPGGQLFFSNDLGCSFYMDNSNALGVLGGTGLACPFPVGTGGEWKIPLSLIGNPAGPIKLCVFINGGGHDYLSNQIIGGIGGGGNLGEPRTVNFANINGDQYGYVPGTQTAITGILELQNFAGSTPTPCVTFEVRDSIGNPISTQTVERGTGGEYRVFVPGAGTYQLSTKVTHWLRRTITVTTGAGGATANISLINGDLDQNNFIDSDDFDILVGAFGNPGPIGDIDESGTVDSDDFDVLVQNFGTNGDN